MNSILLVFFVLIAAKFVSAQDFVVKNNDDVIRGTVKGTDYYSVWISVNDESDVILLAKDVKNFFWNGNTYLTRGFAGRKTMEFRFVKVLEFGKVNLYAFGGESLMPAQKERKVRIRPSVGIGAGTGGFGGVGMGGGISIGAGRGTPDVPAGAAAVRYFIEKPGAGPLQEIPMKAITDEEQKNAVRSILLQKLGDQPKLLNKVENSADFNSRDVINLVQEYNKK